MDGRCEDIRGIYYAKYYGKGGGGNGRWGKKFKLGGKLQEGKEKRRKIILKMVEKALKMHLFEL